jgi:hypothetical protein
MFDFTTMSRVLGIWFVAYPEKDLMAVAWQETVLSRPRARWRLRFYDPAATDPFDDTDEQAWYDIELAPGYQGNLVADVQAWLAQICETWHEPTTLVDEFVGPSSPAEASAWMQTRRWVYTKEVGPDDPEAQTGG